MFAQRHRGQTRDLGAGQTVLLVIILVVLLAVAFAIYLVLPTVKDTLGPCSSYDVEFHDGGVDVWWDPNTGTDYGSATRKIIYFPDGMSGDMENFKWGFVSMGYTSFYSPYDQQTKQKMIDRVADDFEAGLVDSHGYDWFLCAVDDLP